MRKRALFALIALLLVLPLVIHAEGDPHENACYEGGSMWRDNGDGCPTEWHWLVGWYLANWENNGGHSNPDNFFPDWGNPQSVLPPLPEPPEPSSDGDAYPSAGCLLWETGPTYLDFGGGWNLSTPMRYSDAACTNPSSTIDLKFVYAPAPYDAEALCNEAFPGLITFWKSGVTDVIYLCWTG